MLACGLFVAAACGSEKPAPPPEPDEPEIVRLEREAETVHPGDSVQLAVVARPKSETSGGDAGMLEADAGESSTQQQGLSHDASSVDARGEDGGASGDTGTADDVGATNDAASMDDATDRRDASVPSDAASPADATRADDTATGEPDTSSGTNDTSSGTNDTATGRTDTGTPGVADTGTSGMDAGPSTPPPSGSVPEGWEVTWTIEGDGWSVEQNGATASVTAPERYESTTTIEVTVEPPKGPSDSAETTLTTGSNTAPSVDEMTASPNPVEPTETVEVTVDASDPNGDELSYDWSAPGAWRLASSSGTKAVVESPDQDGVFTEVRVRVQGGAGGDGKNGAADGQPGDDGTTHVENETVRQIAVSIGSVTKR